MKKIYVCSDTQIGIFSAIYEAWKTKLEEDGVGIALCGMVDQALFCEYLEVQEEEKKMLAVEKMIRKHLGEYAYWNIYHALLSHDEKKGDAILGMMLAARKIPDSKRIMEHLTHPKVEKVFSLGRKVANEAHYYHEFVRFSELENGILFSEIEPRNRILSCLGEHFSNRFPLENWMIYDRTHDMALVHEKGKKWTLVHDIQKVGEIKGQFATCESLYVELWQVFFRSISITERESHERQRQNLPLLFRSHMTEFQEQNGGSVCYNQYVNTEKRGIQ